MTMNEKEDRIYKLYVIFNTINNKMYIGYSCNTKRRWQEHKKKARQIIKGQGDKTCYAIHFAMAKYGIENFVFKELEGVIGFPAANEREVELIRIARDCKFQLYNETDGGEGGKGNPGKVWTEEERQEMSKRMKGKGNPMYGVQLFGSANGNFGKGMKPHVKEILLKIRCKLTPEQVEEIKRLHSIGNQTQRALAKQFNISETQIHDIITGQSWNNGQKSNHIVKPNLKPEQVIEIRKLYKTGDYTQKELAKNYGVSVNQIYRIVNRKRWKNI